MSSSTSDSESTYNSEEWEDVSDIEEEPDDQQAQAPQTTRRGDLRDMEPYADEPLANKEWLAQYEKDMAESEMLEEKFKDRLRGMTPVSEW